ESPALPAELTARDAALSGRRREKYRNSAIWAERPDGRAASWARCAAEPARGREDLRCCRAVVCTAGLHRLLVGIQLILKLFRLFAVLVHLTLVALLRGRRGVQRQELLDGSIPA